MIVKPEIKKRILDTANALTAEGNDNPTNPPMTLSVNAWAVVRSRIYHPLCVNGVPQKKSMSSPR